MYRRISALTFSIITVCYNAESTIDATIKSVLRQSCSDFEYLIIDGASKDSTVNIAKQYMDDFKKRGIKYVISSEKDAGIYNAMNKGAHQATGDWILYLNAGDYLCSERVLEQIKVSGKLSEAEIVYGDVIKEKMGFYRYESGSEMAVIKRRIPFCHQSVFTDRTLLVGSGYNETYKICADYDFYLKCYQEHRTFGYISIPISVFIEDGISSKYDIGRKLPEEELNIRYCHGIINKREYDIERIISLIKKVVRLIKWISAKFVPQSIKNKWIVKQLENEGWKKEFPL